MQSDRVNPLKTAMIANGSRAPTIVLYLRASTVITQHSIQVYITPADRLAGAQASQRRSHNRQQQLATDPTDRPSVRPSVRHAAAHGGHAVSKERRTSHMNR